MFVVWISWSQWLNPLQNSVKDFCKVFHFFSMRYFLCCSIKREQSPLLGVDRQTEDTTQGEIPKTDSDLYNRQRQDRRHREYEVENLNLESLLVKWHQGEMLFYLSLIWHWCFICNSKLMTCAYNLYYHLHQMLPFPLRCLFSLSVYLWYRGITFPLALPEWNVFRPTLFLNSCTALR